MIHGSILTRTNRSKLFRKIKEKKKTEDYSFDIGLFELQLAINPCIFLDHFFVIPS